MKQFTPNMNDGETIFVFGSNESGIHGAGASLEARRNWGAIDGVGFGPMPKGQSFAIPTKDWDIKTLPLPIIECYVKRFLDFAKLSAYYKSDKKRFLVTAIGCGLAGYHEDDIRPMFKDAPPNCVLPDGWRTP